MAATGAWLAVLSWVSLSSFPAGAAAGPSAASTPGGSAAWLQFQGGPGHAGSILVGGPAPPLRVVWRFAEPKGEVGLAGTLLDGGRVIALGKKAVYGVDAATGELAWTIARDGGALIVPAIAHTAKGDELLFTEGESAKKARLAAFDLGTRKPLWTVALDDTSRSGVTVDGDRAFLADRSGTLYAIDLSVHRVLWKEPGPGVVDAPAVSTAGKVIAVYRDRSSGQVQVIARDAATGKGAWASTGSASVFGSAPTVSGDTVVVGLASVLTVDALRVGDGATRWSARVRSPFFPLVGAATAGSDVLVAATCPGPGTLSCPGTETGLYRLDGRTGHREWDFEFDGGDISPSRQSSSPVVAGNTVYLGLADGRLEAVDLSTGVRVSELSTGHGPLGPIAGGGGMLFVSKTGGTGGIVAFAHDPNGTLVHDVSPTVVNVGRTLKAYGLALASVGAAGLALWALLWVRRRRGEPADEATASAADPEAAE